MYSGSPMHGGSATVWVVNLQPGFLPKSGDDDSDDGEDDDESSRDAARFDAATDTSPHGLPPSQPATSSASDSLCRGGCAGEGSHGDACDSAVPLAVVALRRPVPTPCRAAFVPRPCTPVTLSLCASLHQAEVAVPAALAPEVCSESVSTLWVCPGLGADTKRHRSPSVYLPASSPGPAPACHAFASFRLTTATILGRCTQ